MHRGLEVVIWRFLPVESHEEQCMLRVLRSICSRAGYLAHYVWWKGCAAGMDVQNCFCSYSGERYRRV